MSQHNKGESKYTPDPRKWERRGWLYQKYWGEVLSIDEMAALTDVSSQTIVREMDKRGVPRRPANVASDVDDPHDVALYYSRGFDETQTVEPSTDAYAIADGGRAVGWTDVSD